MRHTHLTTIAAALVLSGACSGGETPAPGGSAAESPSTAPSAQSAPDVKPTGKIITVELITDEKGNYFKPAKFEVHRGDLIRFTLVAGVHNVHFLADSNPGKKGLPPVSDFLQLPDQTYDLLVGLAPGHYYFQCDPHALLGMVGHLEVEDDDDD
jgi:plastocyanin